MIGRAPVLILKCCVHSLAYIMVNSSKILHANYCTADDTSRQTTALAILVASMKCAGSNKDCDALCYIYQEYEVKLISLSCVHTHLYIIMHGTFVTVLTVLEMCAVEV